MLKINFLPRTILRSFFTFVGVTERGDVYVNLFGAPVPSSINDDQIYREIINNPAVRSDFTKVLNQQNKLFLKECQKRGIGSVLILAPKSVIHFEKYMESARALYQKNKNIDPNNTLVIMDDNQIGRVIFEPIDTTRREESIEEIRLFHSQHGINAKSSMTLDVLMRVDTEFKKEIGELRSVVNYLVLFVFLCILIVTGLINYSFASSEVGSYQADASVVISQAEQISEADTHYAKKNIDHAPDVATLVAKGYLLSAPQMPSSIGPANLSLSGSLITTKIVNADVCADINEKAGLTSIPAVDDPAARYNCFGSKTPYTFTYHGEINSNKGANQ